MCNNGSFPELAIEPLEATAWGLWVGVAACTVALFALAVFAVVLLRRTHR